jgi:hypothetical protein
MKMKKWILLAAVFCLCLGQQAMAQTVASGTTGDCTWTLTGSSGNYTLTISGTGAMGDYIDNDAPWYSYRNDIKTLVI